MMKKAVCLILTITFILCLCSCGSKESELVGRWVQVSGESMEFFKDGTCVIDTSKESTAISASYEITDDGRLKIKPVGYAYLYKYSIENNTLTLKDTSNNEEEIYYLDVKDKKPKEKYLPEKEVIKTANINDGQQKKIIECNYSNNYTDDNGYYHAVYKSTLTLDCDSPCLGEIVNLDYIYITTDKWVVFDYSHPDDEEYVVLLNDAIGTWEYNDDDIEIEVNIENAENDEIIISYYYKKNEKEYRDTFNKSKFTSINPYWDYENKYNLFFIDDGSEYNVLYFCSDCCIFKHYFRGSSFEGDPIYLKKVK